MPATINLEASRVWDFFQTHKDMLMTKTYLLASHPEFGTEIYLTEAAGFPEIIVLSDDYTCDEECAITKTECERVVSRFYDEYLTNHIVGKTAGIQNSTADADDDSPLSQDDMISERELELDDAIFDFLDCVTADGSNKLSMRPDFDDMCEDLKEHFLEYMARKHGLKIYRPMVLEDDKGEEFFEEYPYECMDFDDDNPIYQPDKTAS